MDSLSALRRLDALLEPLVDGPDAEEGGNPHCHRVKAKGENPQGEEELRPLVSPDEEEKEKGYPLGKKHGEQDEEAAVKHHRAHIPLHQQPHPQAAEEEHQSVVAKAVVGEEIAEHPAKGP